MRITFKDVGQGDSIILEWSDNGVDKVGIIDCNRKASENPVLQHIQDAGYSEIEFAILSHPHVDHYSGFIDILEHCEKKSLSIKAFYHTVSAIGSEYWKYFEVGSEDSEMLGILFRKVWELHELNLLEIRYLAVEHPIDLGQGVQLLCLAPSHDDILRCQEILRFDPKTNKKRQSSAVNHLATIFKLCLGDRYILFTSDAENEAFQTIIDRRASHIDGKELLLCQVPHHGSFKNYHAPFWTRVTNKESNPAVVSSGKNDKYHHPHFDTLMAFHSRNYTIHSTTDLYGIQEYVAEIRRLTMMLEVVSTSAEDHEFFGDQVFDVSAL